MAELHGARVLVVDDEADVRYVVRATLPEYEIREADGLDAARRQLADGPVDVVVLDLMLGRDSGLDLLRDIRHTPLDLDGPSVIILSALVQESVAAFDEGADDFVLKPFRLDELRARVDMVLRRREGLQVLRSHAFTDPLTGIGNRRAFDERLRLLWEREASRGRTIALILLDLDHMKTVNDTHGHVAGDRYLRAVAAQLGSIHRRGEEPCRVGGDEFAILMAGSYKDALAVAHRVHEAIRDTPLDPDLAMLRASASVGVAFGPGPDVMVPGDLLPAADQGLYKAKTAGGDAVA